MRLEALFTTLWLSASLARAVLIEDAFKKDWIHYNYGTLSSPQLLDDSSLIGLSNKNYLYTIDVENGRVKSFIDLSIHENDQFAVFENVIVTYSKTSPQISLFEKNSGIFIASMELKSVPVSIKQVSNKGLAVLQSNGDLVYWEGNKLVELGSYKQKDFTNFGTQDKTFIIIGSQSIELSLGDDDVTHQVVTSDKWNHYLIDKKRPESYVHNVNDQYSVQKVGSSLVIAKILNNGATESYRKDFPSILDIEVSNTTVAVVTEGKVVLIKLSNFLKTGSKNSIETETFDVPTPLSARLFESALSTLANEGNDVRIEKVDLNSKSRVSFSIPLVTITPSGKSILVDKPESLSKLDLAHHLAEETQSASVLLHWILRYKNHLVTLGKFLSSLRHNDFSTSHAEGDKYGFGKILLSIDDTKRILVATDSNDGSKLWDQKIEFKGELVDLVATKENVYLVSEHSLLVLDLRTGQKISTEPLSTKVEKVFQITSDNASVLDEKASKIIALKTGDSLKFIPEDAHFSSPQYFFKSTASGVTSYKLVENKLVKTWGSEFPNEKILHVSKNKDALSIAAGISRSDRSVLYKYLNPNLVSVISQVGDQLNIRIIDGITGAIIHKQNHNNEKIDFLSVKLEQNDNWVVYTYLSTFPKIEQRVVVIDLFQEEKPKAEESPFIPKNVSISSKAFIFPEKIEAITSTTTKFGITIKSLIALTETGSLIEIPKFVVNSRRIDDRKMTPADYMDDFKLTPYEPLLLKDLHSVLNHKNKILLSEDEQKILVLPTELESTAVVCVVNDLNEFCTKAQPSSSYDLLSTGFDRVKLIITIAILFGAYIATKPFVHSKKLNAKWIV